MQICGNQSLRRNLFRSSLLFLSMVAFGVWDVRLVRASCGDYLSGHGGVGMVGPNLPLQGELASHPAPRDSQKPACSGPNCHRRDSLPLLPTRQITVPQLSEAILSAIIQVADRDGCSLFPAAASDHIISSPAGRIFRPPRSV